MVNRKRFTLDHVINDWFFSVPSIWAHTVLFLLVPILFGWVIFTAIISIEAIYLAIFIGIAQKQQHEQTRAHLTKGK